MISKIKSFSVEEKLLVQAILSEYHKNVMSVGLVFNAWNLRAYAPDNSQVKSVTTFLSYVMDLQIEIGTELAVAGVPEEIRLNAPISKTVFQSMSADKKNTIKALFEELGNKLGDFKMFGTQVYMNIWNNKLIR